MGMLNILLDLKESYADQKSREDKMNFEPVERGENSNHGMFVDKILQLSSRTNVFYYNGNDVLPVLEYIGGYENRLLGDTCRMYFKVSLSNVPSGYYLWEGFVEAEPQTFGKEFGSTVFSIATGRATCKLVLVEKTKEAILI